MKASLSNLFSFLDKMLVSCALLFVCGCMSAPEPFHTEPVVQYISQEVANNTSTEHLVKYLLAMISGIPGSGYRENATIYRSLSALSQTMESGQFEDELSEYAVEIRYLVHRFQGSWKPVINPEVNASFQNSCAAFFARHPEFEWTASLQGVPVGSMDEIMNSPNPFKSIILVRMWADSVNTENCDFNVVRHWRDTFVLPIQRHWNFQTKQYVVPSSKLDKFSFNCLALFTYNSLYDIGVHAPVVVPDRVKATYIENPEDPIGTWNFFDGEVDIDGFQCPQSLCPE